MQTDEVSPQFSWVGFTERLIFLRTAQNLQCSSLGITIEDRVHVLDDVSTDLKEASLVFDWNEGALGSVVPRHLQRFRKGSQRFDVALHAHVAQYEKARADGSLSHRRVA